MRTFTRIYPALLLGVFLFMLMTAGAVAGVYDRPSGETSGRHSDPIATEDDWPDDPTNPGPALPPDYSDIIFMPIASHDIQHLEWLGEIVDQEFVAPADDDVFGKGGDDDGLVAVVFGGGLVTIDFLVWTNWTAHNAAFPAGSMVYVDAWIDWNNNRVFDGAGDVGEYIGTWSGHPEDWGPGPPVGRDWENGQIVGAMAGNPAGIYSIRLRVNWRDNGEPHVVAVGGQEDWGEVEDYFHYDPVTGECEGYPQGPGIPSLTEYGLLALAVLLMIAAIWIIRKRRIRTPA